MRDFIAAAAVILAAFAVAAAPTPAMPRWRMQYFYDQDQSRFEIADLAFSSEQRGIAVGTIINQKRRGQPMSIITRDGGAHWEQVPLPENPVSLFLLNDNSGWLVTEKGIWYTDEAGRSWKRVKKIQGVHRVTFLNEQHGWATGAPKLFKETKDGGKTWTEVPAVEKIDANAEHTYFDWMEWVSPKQAIVLGANVAPRRDSATWMDPEALARRREWPGLSLTLETMDGGSTWTPQTAPTFGRLYRFRRGHDVSGALSLVRFVNTFDYPSEVYMLDLKGKSTRVFRDKQRNVTDVGWFGRSALLFAVEPPGRLFQLPLPGKLHVLQSLDMKNWVEMKVDYRAFGQRAIYAAAGPNVWVATDAGQILKLAN